MAKDLFHIENMRSRGEIAAYLRQIADKLDHGEPLTLRSGNQEVELQLPDRAEFEVKVEQEQSFRGKKGETSLELDIEWDASGERIEEEGFEIA